MSTTERSHLRSRTTLDLPEVRRRRRLENLLYTRKRLVELEAEYLAHGLDDALELYTLRLEVEQVFADEFPHEFEDLLPAWLEEEIRHQHHPRSSWETCGLCAAIRRHLDGDDFDSPQAA